jgi:hypothetical protein
MCGGVDNIHQIEVFFQLTDLLQQSVYFVMYESTIIVMRSVGLELQAHASYVMSDLEKEQNQSPITYQPITKRSPQIAQIFTEEIDSSRSMVNSRSEISNT